MENTLLAAEIIQGYHSTKGPKRIMIKVDLAKAFDTVDWRFITTCLRSLHIPEIFLRWITACITTPAFSVGFNGNIHGYFKGKCGLRQGDPLSPYLFVIAMNCLSLLLDKAASEGKIGYHANCEQLKITHLCFADDLLIFTDGSLSSVTNILSVLQEFHSYSGLALNINKTSFFSSGLSALEISDITAATGFHHAELPTTYLGLPLTSRKLTTLTCAPLLQKIKGKMTNWAAKTLSFAGRLQLIQSVINGITTFWTSSFILPKACVKEVNSLCASFLWKGSVEGRYTARVAWSKITAPKAEGGLGLRDLVTWNVVCALKLIWMVFFKPSSLWVAWFQRAILKDDLHSFWTLTSKPRYSWLVRKLFKLRETAYSWFVLKPGNGQYTSFWFANWSPLGNLSKLLTVENCLSSGIPRNATLATLWSNGHWSLPPARSEEIVQIQAFLSTFTLSQILDSYTWSTPTSKSQKFVSSDIYNLLRAREEEVPWHMEIWFSNSIPRHAFQTWLFALNRCPTRDRLITWGLSVNPICLLCNATNESRNHLFFECSFSSAIWTSLSDRLGLPSATNWNLILDHLHNITTPRHRKILTRLAWQAAIYFLWQERNHRLHRSSFRSTQAILLLIDSIIRNRASSLRHSQPRLASDLLQSWFAVNRH